MKLYKEFYREENASICLNKWIRANSSKYDYKVAGYQGSTDYSSILIAYWPKKAEHK